MPTEAWKSEQLKVLKYSVFHQHNISLHCKLPRVAFDGEMGVI